MSRQDPTGRHALLAASIVGGAAATAVLGSWRLFEFDPALFIYAEALVLSLALTVYRLTIWVHRPPTRMLYQQAFRMALTTSGLGARLWHVLVRSIGYFGLNRFVWKRGVHRWSAHWPIMLGCVMAMGIVLPLILGWVWFETPSGDLHSYRVMLWGHPIRTMPVDGMEAFLAFHGLVWASLPVVIGTAVALWRRRHDRGDQAVQTFGNDLAPLYALLAISLTGLLMTVSYSLAGGTLHRPLAVLHCCLVVGTLLWLPYSKLIHVPQRTLKLAHLVYAHEGTQGGRAACQRCGHEFADRQQIDDLIQIQQTLGYRYDRPDPGINHYQWICPPCRRATLVIAQGARWRAAGERQRQLETTVEC